MFSIYILVLVYLIGNCLQRIYQFIAKLLQFYYQIIDPLMCLTPFPRPFYWNFSCKYVLYCRRNFKLLLHFDPHKVLPWHVLLNKKNIQKFWFQESFVTSFPKKLNILALNIFSFFIGYNCAGSLSCCLAYNNCAKSAEKREIMHRTEKRLVTWHIHIQNALMPFTFRMSDLQSAGHTQEYMNHWSKLNWIEIYLELCWAMSSTYDYIFFLLLGHTGNFFWPYKTFINIFFWSHLAIHCEFKYWYHRIK